MTGMEVSTIIRFGLNPVIIVLNNKGYGTERPMLEPFTIPFEFGGSPVPLPVATIMSPLFVICMNLPLQLEVPSWFVVLSIVAIWFPKYLPVIVPFSLISIFTELLLTSRMRLSVTLDLIVNPRS
jgi:hypothetical protein